MTAVFKTSSDRNPARDFTVNFPAGQEIFHEGDLGTEMYIIQEGTVEIIKNFGGETRLLTTLEKGDFFGEMAVLENTPRSADAIARTDVRLLEINGSRFDELLRKTPEVAVRIIRKYSKRLREANQLIEKLAGQHVEVEESSLDHRPEVGQQIGQQIAHNRFVELETGTAFYLSSDDHSTIGRADPVTGILPDIDLTVVDTNRSVSRRHAKALHEGEIFSILEEVGTVNGTFVNGERIPTGVPVPIKNGDQLRVGLVEMKVVFEP